MKKNNLKNLISLSLLVATFSANSAIVYQADDRYINHGQGGTFTPSVDYSDFVDDYWAYETGAFQDTTMDSNSMSGSGSTYAGFDAANSYGYDSTSVYSVSFGVDQLTDFALSGSLDTFNYGSFLSVTLSENGVNLFSLDTYDGLADGINLFSFDGQFTVGNSYQLLLKSQSTDSDYYSEEWKFNLQTTSAVPVPAAVWLFGSGLIALVGFARKKS